MSFLSSIDFDRVRIFHKVLVLLETFSDFITMIRRFYVYNKLCEYVMWWKAQGMAEELMEVPVFSSFLARFSFDSQMTWKTNSKIYFSSFFIKDFCCRQASIHIKLPRKGSYLVITLSNRTKLFIKKYF